MPMEPGKDETQDEFMSRCVPEMIGTGPDKRPQEQAVAICLDIWREAHPEDAYRGGRPKWRQSMARNQRRQAPAPEAGESHDDFMTRCTAELEADGFDETEAEAACQIEWDERKAPAPVVKTTAAKVRDFRFHTFRRNYRPLWRHCLGRRLGILIGSKRIRLPCSDITTTFRSVGGLTSTLTRSSKLCAARLTFRRAFRSASTRSAGWLTAAISTPFRSASPAQVRISEGRQGRGDRWRPLHGPGAARMLRRPRAGQSERADPGACAQHFSRNYQDGFCRARQSKPACAATGSHWRVRRNPS